MIGIYAATILVSAALLFMVQPLAAKLLLPTLGGTPAVWNTCMVFFQALLLLGYCYADLTTRWLGSRRQAVLHLVLAATPLLFLPIQLLHQQLPPPATFPFLWILQTLMWSFGLPFFVVATTSPLLQRWLSQTNAPAARDPYWLYAASNVGSLAGLLSYPFIVEPLFTLPQQGLIWAIGYGLFLCLLALAAIFLWLNPMPETAATATDLDWNSENRNQPTTRSENETKVPSARNHWQQRLIWLGLSFVPSSLLLGVTSYITMDIASFPLLWIIPMTLYLLSFVFAFQQRDWIPMRALLRWVAYLLLLTALSMVVPRYWPLLICHLVTFFLVALMSHRQLAQDRPQPSRLTEFYFWMSLGGVCGGIFNAIVAPLLFSMVLEYPLGLWFAAFVWQYAFHQSKLIGTQEQPAPQTVDNASATLSPIETATPSETMETNKAQPAVSALSKENWVTSGWQAALLVGYVLAGYLLVLPWLRQVFGEEQRHLLDSFTNLFLIGLPGAIVFSFLDKPVRFACALLAFLLTVSLHLLFTNGDLLTVKRSFFAVHFVFAEKRDVLEPPDTLPKQLQPELLTTLPGQLPSLANALPTRQYIFNLAHGQTIHGSQSLQQLTEPLAYYDQHSAIGLLLRRLSAKSQPAQQIGLIGLGVGTIACYHQPGQHYTYFEIDPVVKEIAEDERYFTFLKNCGAGNYSIILGDGRLTLQQQPDAQFDVLVVDAFSSDAIPVHLLTREALQIYIAKLAPNGVLAIHISNNYLDLEPIVANLAADAQLEAYKFDQNVYFTHVFAKALTEIPKEKRIAAVEQRLREYQALRRAQNKHRSIWMILAQRREDLLGLVEEPGWSPAKGNDNPPWTDNYSNLLEAFIWFQGH